jgi:transposase-like protein
MSGALKILPLWNIRGRPTQSASIIGTDPVAFGELIHRGSSGYRLFTSQRSRLDGTVGRPHHQFFQQREWLSQIAAVSGEVGYFYCFSSFRSPTAADTANLADVGALFQDLDWHTHPDASQRYGNGEKVLAEVDRRCLQIGFPVPNLVIYSGRGLQIAWLHDAVPASTNLVAWNAAQKAMCAMLADLGADTKAKPAVHFFKLPGQLNPKSGRRVAVIRQPDGDRFTFSELFNRLYPEGLPTPKAKAARRPSEKPARVVIDLAAARALRTGASTAQRATDRMGADADSAGQLIWSPRLRALKTIIEHRADQHGGCLPEGKRDGILFVTAVALGWVTPDRWRDEYLSIAADYCGAWTAKEALDRASAVAKRVGALLNGDSQDPRYRMSNETVREIADISAAEESLLGASAIARRAIQQSARAHRQAEARRTVGRTDRERVTGLDAAGYREKRKTDAAERAERAREMAESGRTTAEIAADFGCSSRAVRGWMNEGGIDGTRCMLSSFSSSFSFLDSVRNAPPKPAPEPASANAERTAMLTQLAEFAAEMRQPGACPTHLPIAVPRHLTRDPAVRAALTAATAALRDAERRHRNRMAQIDAEERSIEMRQRAAQGLAAARTWFAEHLDAVRQEFDCRIAEADDRERGYLLVQREAVVMGRCRAWKAAVRHSRGLPPQRRQLADTRQLYRGSSGHHR